ncbi:MAG: hypothetical protein JJT75_05320 [Opitutales bacterium]|nr:hypothetical protein [Opitutales bacterium]MCH8541681.1 hypothetical protein [Opitutales bacterium]
MKNEQNNEGSQPDPKPAEENEKVQDAPPESVQQPSSGSGEDIEKVKVISALAYLIFFLPLLVNSESRYGKFHANQGLLLLLTSLAINIVGGIIPVVGWFIIWPLGMIFVFILFVMGIINAFNGKTEPLPLIGKYTIIK